MTASTSRTADALGRGVGQRQSVAALASLLCLLAVFTSHTTRSEGPNSRERSPYVAVPLLSSSPKLDTSVGVLLGYLKSFDEASPPSFFAVSGTYSASESHTLVAFGQTFFDQGRQRFNFAASQGRVNNDYENFLDSGMPAQTTDNIEALAARYLFSPARYWYVGAQVLSSNYVIESEGLVEQTLQDIGLTGLDSVGLGLVAQYDSRNNLRNATQGKHFLLQNYGYREALGSSDDFDVVRADLVSYSPVSERFTLATQVAGRWTRDAPVTGYSSISLRGYVRGMYLAENYTHLAIDNRIRLGGNWSANAYGGLACLYASMSDCSGSSNLYPAVGVGLSYVLRPEAGIILRADATFGKDDNRAFYLNLNQPF
ncbi:MAG: hypothetical protein ACO3RT_07210 [Arenicellales bacterium]|nr:hypothetical protein [Gammaproteobacteria bacterium]NDA14084.1 hypothetical protein [Gammaproteobacteria bacterium]NDG43532.1 hypothetical protein [Gammaproteobacteria bacterium]